MPVERVVAVSAPLVSPLPPKLNDELFMLKVALEVAVTRRLVERRAGAGRRSRRSPVVSAPELGPAAEGTNATLEPREETWVHVALALSSPSFMMLSWPFPPGMPVEWVDAVSEPLVPPVPPKLNDELLMLKLALELAVTRPLLWMKSSSSPPSMPAALVTAPDVAPAPDEPNTTVEPPEEESVEVAATVSAASL